uniref:Uncharacterized protein n=1 Tax=Gopherus agassizii TaxID=38772 RepID=A0A452HBX6_9SAUR
MVQPSQMLESLAQQEQGEETQAGEKGGLSGTPAHQVASWMEGSTHHTYKSILFRLYIHWQGWVGRAGLWADYYYFLVHFHNSL